VSNVTTNILPSSTLDTSHHEPRTCTARKVRKGKVTGPVCGKRAVVEAIRTCCEHSEPTYWCHDHVDLCTTSPIRCPYCLHWCHPGFCFHRIINTI
jgi:hypothetical protein